MNVCALIQWHFSERKSIESIYPLAVGLDSNFRQDVRIRHFHGYWIGALCPPVSVKLENVFLFVGFFIAVHGWKVGGGGEAQSHEDFRVGVILGVGCGNRDKQGSDDDDDGGTWTVPKVLLCVSVGW